MTTNPPSPQGDHSGALPLETLELIEDAIIAVLRGRPPKECRPALARAFTSMCRSLEAWGGVGMGGLSAWSRGGEARRARAASHLGRSGAVPGRSARASNMRRRRRIAQVWPTVTH
jgi:hypothetical protein